MLEDLNLIGFRYVCARANDTDASWQLICLQSIITLVFFISYVLFQPPATVACKKIGPRYFLSTITFLWGCTMIGMGFAPDWSSMAGLRVLLGVLEAGFFPGSVHLLIRADLHTYASLCSCVYLLSTWYVRYEMGKRYGFFYILGMLASACSGILAYGLMQMGGLANMGGWQWIVS